VGTVIIFIKLRINEKARLPRKCLEYDFNVHTDFEFLQYILDMISLIANMGAELNAWIISKERFLDF